MRTAAARARPHAPGRTAAPRHHRRVSGPLRPLTTGTPARVRGRTSVFERIRALPEHRVVDGLLRSRAWIVVIAVMLGGIVAMQVSLLKLNSGISRAVETASTLERQNADMQDSIARLSSGSRVRDAAVQAGMVAPPAGDIGFVTARGERDARLAAERLTPPSDSAEAVMAAGGHAVAQPTVMTDPTAVTTTAPTTVTPTAPQG